MAPLQSHLANESNFTLVVNEFYLEVLVDVYGFRDSTFKEEEKEEGDRKQEL